MKRRIKARRRSAIRLRRIRAKDDDAPIMRGYQYVPPKKRARDKLREILRIIRE